MEQIKKIFTSLVMAATAIYLLIGGLVYAVDFSCFNPNFYAEKHAALGIAEKTGMDAEDLDKSMRYVLDYLKGEHEELDVKATIDGAYREVFNDRERAHMVDVRNLYQGVKFIGNACLIMAVIFLIAMFILGRKQAALMYKSFVWTIVGVIAVLAALCLYAALDFNSFWTAFHGVFFTNDLWLLNPATDLMIVMLPGEIFFAIVIKTAAFFIGFAILLIILATVAYKLYRKKVVQNG